MLRTKLFLGFAALVVLFSAVSAFIGLYVNQRRILAEAQKRVQLDLDSARAVLHGRAEAVETIMRMIGTKQIVLDTAAAENWQDPEVLARLSRVRANFGLDVLDLLSADGVVRVRTTAPERVGDCRLTDPSVAAAMKGQTVRHMTVMSRAELARESDDLAERAYLELDETPRARKTLRTDESRGLLMVSAVPVMKGSQVVGVVYGGILLNRNLALVDRICEIVYRNEMYKDVPVGTTTLFLGDTRIATTVRKDGGNRALGTRVSKVVADSVLDNARPWIGEAFVVKEPYLAAYEPIRDGRGEIVGMFYVGTLKRPFQDEWRAVAVQYLGNTLVALVAGLVLAYVIAGRLAAPIHRLVEVAKRVTNGDRPPPVDANGACDEVGRLVHSFNQMTATLTEREERLKTLNRSYMETLGFVSHELKSPVATIMNYTYLLRERKLGDLNERQVKAVRAIDGGGARLVEMVRHYLNLARIENGELKPAPTHVELLDEVVAPVLETAESEIAAKGMSVANAIGPEIALQADRNMVREIFENLVGNAIKYGRAGGAIRLAAEPDGAMVRFRVRNDGEGIPTERLPQLFQKFTRIEGTEGAKRQRGTGLGLFITRNIVEAHGGRIEARSEPGSWVEFVFTLPRWVQASAPAEAGLQTGQA
jgi:two-component system NtrC family sensor kinase